MCNLLVEVGVNLLSWVFIYLLFIACLLEILCVVSLSVYVLSSLIIG